MVIPRFFICNRAEADFLGGGHQRGYDQIFETVLVDPTGGQQRFCVCYGMAQLCVQQKIGTETGGNLLCEGFVLVQKL